MFKKILIANRGEIAVRIARACREMGITPVAVYSEADAHALHVRSMPEAHLLGPAPALESYLKIDAVIEAARRAGAEALHPGYGFLSERAALAEACVKAGIVFIGPPAGVIRSLGDKITSKKIAREAGVPVVPGSDGGSTDLDSLERAAKSMALPILIKASAGGGGKGMRVVRDAAEMRPALEGASREAGAAFGDATVFLERYLENPRHVEVQILADAHGHVVALGERECSLQRRHQKIWEESPSPGLHPDKRASLLESACKAARAAGYVNAGTVEFIVDSRSDFYFLEVNTRLQVEHPVTELVTGLDLVKLQIRVAAGEKLPFTQEDIRPRGHAIEVRLYAEDPAHGYLPTSGRLEVFEPPVGPGIRNDVGVGPGDEVGIHYDPMLAKLIVSAESREEALARLAVALADYRIAGLTTNLEFLRWLCERPEVRAGETTTGYLDAHPYRPEAPVPPAAWLDAAALVLAGVADPGGVSAWRPGRQDIPVRTRTGDLETLTLLSNTSGNTWRASRGALSTEWTLDSRGRGSAVLAGASGERVELRWSRTGDAAWIQAGGISGVVSLAPALAEESVHHGHHGPASLTAPMPGAVIRVMVSEGDTVEEGQRMLVLEAMKMEHTMAAPARGVVRKLPFKVGAVVPLGAVLVEMEEE